MINKFRHTTVITLLYFCTKIEQMNLKFRIEKGRVSEIVFVLWAGLSALVSYSLVTALRKPYTAATFDGYLVGDFDYKTILTTVQILGYVIAKFAGIKIISELKKADRLKFIFFSVLIAEFSLVMFGFLPAPYNIIAMFFNGLSLGCMWGVIFSFLEGRKVTDILASLMGLSIVISTGTVKSIALFVLNNLNISEFWMPAFIGAIAFPLIMGTGWLLSILPEPTSEDKELKAERFTLQGNERKNLIMQYLPILILLFIPNLLITILRDIKEDFLIDIFDASAYSEWIFAQVDIVVTLIILALFGIMVFFKNNFTALTVLISIIILTSLGLSFISLNYNYFISNPVVWLFLMSLGLYIPYLAYQTLFFDRFIACFRIHGNVGFFIAMVDFIGYTGTVIVLIVKEFVNPSINWLVFYNSFSVWIGLLSAISSLIAFFLITLRYKKTSLSKIISETHKSVVNFKLEFK